MAFASGRPDCWDPSCGRFQPRIPNTTRAASPPQNTNIIRVPKTHQPHPYPHIIATSLSGRGGGVVIRHPATAHHPRAARRSRVAHHRAHVLHHLRHLLVHGVALSPEVRGHLITHRLHGRRVVHRVARLNHPLPRRHCRHGSSGLRARRRGSPARRKGDPRRQGNEHRRRHSQEHPSLAHSSSPPFGPHARTLS